MSFVEVVGLIRIRWEVLVIGEIDWELVRTPFDINRNNMNAGQLGVIGTSGVCCLVHLVRLGAGRLVRIKSAQYRANMFETVVNILQP